MKSSTRSEETCAQLLQLSREIGREERRLAILGEGNTSAKIDDETFWVKASGSTLRDLSENDVVQCRAQPMLDLMNQSEASDEAIEAALMNCRVDVSARKPSVETIFHADLLSLPNINFVGHAHPIAVNSILCSEMAETFAQNRLFPDEIVCCGEASALVEYVDPGLRLGQAIRVEVTRFQEKYGAVPRVILLKNHGVITLGANPQAVLAAMLMCAKAAEITLGACAIGTPKYLTGYDVRRISGRRDEHYRQKALGLK